MIRTLKLFDGQGYDPHYNLAVEQQLLETVPEGACVLYLWQNQNTVVIGRNQNARKECRVELLREDGVALARRSSGGGAVFHDLGNLNFTFLAPSEEYDVHRQAEVILRACRATGVPAELSGRNDLTADGRKFSGSAFFHHRGRSLHHGTLLVDVDTEKMARYLRPSEAKLRAKGVDSVRARVVNLSAFDPAITVPALRERLIAAFEEVYGLPAERMEQSDLDAAAVRETCERYRSWEWIYGPKLPVDLTCESRFSWGEVRLELSVNGGVVRRVSAWTDAMDWTLPDRLSDALVGCRFEIPILCEKISALGIPEAEDICELLRGQDL